MNIEKTILIPTYENFSFEECIWFLNRNYDDCLHSVSKTGIIKAIQINNEVYLISLKEKIKSIEVEILNNNFNEETKNLIVSYVKDWLDVERDIKPFYDLLEQNEKLAYMVEEYKGLRLIGIEDLFETLCWSIIGQQINLTFAYKLKRRLVEKFGTAIEFNGEVYHIFPSCEVLSSITIEELREMQFSKQKAEYIIGSAKAFFSKELSKEKIKALPDFISKHKALTNIKGIGVWTANYALMKSLRESQAIPFGDVGLLNALKNHEIINERSETEKIKELFKKFAGWESYLVIYLWRSLAEMKN